MTDIESKIARMRNLSLILYSLDSFFVVFLSILIFGGISFTLATSYTQLHHVVIPYDGLNFITASFLVFAAIFDVVMVISTEIMIARLFNFSLGVMALTIISAILYLVLNNFRASSSPYAVSIKPFIDVVSIAVIILSIGAFYTVLTLKKLEKRLSE
ncbi:hypothetical protein [Acidianus sp. HS-5]|uniref:hypothetical protein n=1 Tax=Acidianus sp. HS-5 TaxID=2886040 RepID=UPI001F394651|nr:hypothetical protein [Acidianus sp. HS-5]BDC18269.1 hypothetical protein HS5_11590 [Acidianus sp. HS-5]